MSKRWEGKHIGSAAQSAACPTLDLTVPALRCPPPLLLQIIGPITIPCNYDQGDLAFSAEDCKYSDADGWVRYASMIAEVGRAGPGLGSRGPAALAVIRLLQQLGRSACCSSRRLLPHGAQL